MAPRFTSFVLLAEMRTGSNLLQAQLNRLSGVTCHGELFNPAFIDRQACEEFMGVDLAARDRDPLGFLAQMRAAGPGLTGFRFFHDHDPRVLDALLPDRRVAKIVLTRNPLDSYISLCIARATGQWRLTDARRHRSARVRFDAAEFTDRLQTLQSFQLRLLRALQESGQTAFYLDYADVPDAAVLAGLARFLGVPPRAGPGDVRLKKQNPGEPAAMVTNPEEMAAALARLDRFDLGRTPAFEPRRSAGPTQAVVTRGAPLLFLPIGGGPEAEVTAWLGRFGGLQNGLTARELRQWRRSHPGHRSFTVLRHPLARAHHAFCSGVLTGRLAALRNRLIRAEGIDLPPTDAPPDPQSGLAPGWTDAAHRAAFLGYLRLVRQGLDGQTGLVVDAAWASQTALLQGLAEVHPPDLVLREDRLAEGLAFLAAETGLAAPPAPVIAPPMPLARIHGDDLEQAARAAYERDYLGFGFGPWAPTPVPARGRLPGQAA